MSSTKSAMYWFRNDLRLHDNLALLHAIQTNDYLLPVYCHDVKNQANLSWDFHRSSQLRAAFISSCLDDLKHSIELRGSMLLECYGNTEEQLLDIAKKTNIHHIVCEDIQAPEEIAQVERLRALGLQVSCIWQSSLLLLEDLPFAPKNLPDVFTAFRQNIEKTGCLPRAPKATPASLPAPPLNLNLSSTRPTVPNFEKHDGSSFPFYLWENGGESQALIQLQNYFSSDKPIYYKQTRNQLTGWDYSTKFSVWLAIGAISPRTIYQALKLHESEYGASDGSYWIWFELLWRDYFRFLHFKYARKLYRPRGLSNQKIGHINHDAIHLWRRGITDQKFIDAAMNELFKTGFLSNRLRQIVASYLIYDMHGDWRAGAAWFEAQLLDYDVYSNQGNWLYIAGLGTDPRGGRHFDVKKQEKQYDFNGIYINHWLAKY
jgi:deoxyribodipyrimidine photo-lyase